MKRFSPLSSAKVQKNGSKKVPAAAATAAALEGFKVKEAGKCIKVKEAGKKSQLNLRVH